MKTLRWEEFNEILISNSNNKMSQKVGEQLFLQHYESYFENTKIGTGRALNIEIRNHVNFSVMDVFLDENILIPNEYPTAALAIYLCVSGRVDTDIEGSSISGGQWGIYCVPKGTYNFKIFGTNEKKYQVLGVHFSHESFRKFLGENYKNMPMEIVKSVNSVLPFARAGSYPIGLHDRVLQLMNSKFDELYDKLRLEGLIYEVMSYVVESYEKTGIKNESYYVKIMDDVCKLILKDPFNRYASVELASKFGLSDSQFYKVFKSIYGISPNQFIIDNKLIAARSLLEDEGISVKEVAFISGYESVSSFSRQFKNRFGIRPGKVSEKGH